MRKATTILSIKEGTSSEAADPVYRIGLSDGTLFSFKAAYLKPPGGEGPWEVGGELSSDEEGALRFAAACYRAERIALRLVARAEQNSRGLAVKLARRGQAGPVLGAVLARLEDLGILSDERYAELWLRSRLGRRSSTPRRLEAGLRSRGIDRGTVAAALKKALDDDRELAMLEGYLEKKKLAFDGKDYSLKYRLRGEGFSSSVLERYRDEREA